MCSFLIEVSAIYGIRLYEASINLNQSLLLEPKRWIRLMLERKSGEITAKKM